MYTKIHDVLKLSERQNIKCYDWCFTNLQSKQSEYVGGEELMQHRFANLASRC